MGDVNDGQALIAQLADQGEQLPGIAAREAAGGLVQDQHPAAHGEGARNLDQLLGGDREVPHRGGGMDIAMAEVAEGLGGGGLDFLAVEPAPTVRFETQEDVIRHAQVRGQG
jgi:hypothetical protein